MAQEPRLVAMIVDISGSREHPDRAALQRDLERAWNDLNGQVSAIQKLEPTIGDEFQAVYETTALALQATLLARLMLPPGIDCRFGLGRGDVVDISAGVAGRIQDGSAWWVAREAINEAHARQYGRQPFVRTWYRDAEASDSVVNALLLCRDHLIDRMGERERRLLLGRLSGLTQHELADREGITQSAVSQTLRRSGALALLAGEELLAEVAS